MKKNQKLQKMNLVLNTSSQTFMLIALISLFALPFFIAKNVEPIVKQAENRSKVLSMATDRMQAQNKAVANIPSTPEVLGAETNTNPFTVTAQENNLKFFTTAVQVSEEKRYSVELASDQVFGKIAILKLKNNSDANKSYKFNLLNLNQDLKGRQYLFVDNTKYEIGRAQLPDYISLSADEEVNFYVMNDSTDKTNLVFNVELVEEVVIQ